MSTTGSRPETSRADLQRPLDIGTALERRGSRGMDRRPIGERIRETESRASIQVGAGIGIGLGDRQRGIGGRGSSPSCRASEPPGLRPVAS